MFLANYSDGLTDLDLDRYVRIAIASGAIASLVAVRSIHSCHTVASDGDGWVTGIGPIRNAAFEVNGGFFVMRPEIFDYIKDGEELVVEPFACLAAERKLLSYRHDGFWLAMDTFKDKMTFDHMYEKGIAPWEVRKACRNLVGANPYVYSGDGR
jgi:glucose-1-phosphate cytidylyltransferase